MLDQVFPRYALPAAPWSPRVIFPQSSGVVLEIGSGTGEATLAMARAQPDIGIIAVEVHVRGLGSLVRGAHGEGLANVRVFDGDALVALHDYVPEASLAGVRVWFPDPWPKNRHHKRRLVQSANVALMVSRLQPGGMLHVATDVADYADVIAEVLAAAPGLVPVLVRGPRPPWRPMTKYEKAGLAAGRPAQDFCYVRS